MIGSGTGLDIVSGWSELAGRAAEGRDIVSP